MNPDQPLLIDLQRAHPLEEAVARIPHLPELLSQLHQSERHRGTFDVKISTSGTTGLPKVFSHSLTSLKRGVKISSEHRADRWALCYPLDHMAGVLVLLQAYFNGNILLSLMGSPPSLQLKAISEAKITHISATPTFYRHLIPALTSPIPSVLRITFGGERLPDGLIDSLRPAFPNAQFRNIYATTEGASLLISQNQWFEIPESKKNLIKLSGNELRFHRSLLGKNASRTDTNSVFYKTGDIVELHPSNPHRFRFIKREGIGFNIGGNWVNPLEIEDVLNDHPEVILSRVYAKDNSVMGKILIADIQPASVEHPPTQDSIHAFLKNRLASHLIPRFLNVVETIPLGRTGKITRS